MKSKENLTRLAAMAVIYIAIAIVFIGRLLYLQVSGQDYYTMSTPVTYVTRYEKIQAQRGEIYDRNGAPLVTNDYVYTIMLDYATRPSTQTETGLPIRLTPSRLSAEATSTGSRMRGYWRRSRTQLKSSPSATRSGSTRRWAKG